MIEIREDDLSGPEVRALLHLHLYGMAETSPPESVHALGIEALRAPDVTFWSAWQDGELLGCGALRALTADHGEIKSMRTAPNHLRKGVAAALLRHIVATAAARDYKRLSLETGSGPAFAPAHAFYRSFGFTESGAFADYPPNDPFSRFMSRPL